jgi:hypothetical protein
LHRFVEIAPDADVAVEALERDVREARVAKLIADHVRPRHRERAGTAGQLIAALHVRNQLAHAQLGCV